jgi:hypothetical protein
MDSGSLTLTMKAQAHEMDFGMFFNTAAIANHEQ